jgi:hypothetical protein
MESGWREVRSCTWLHEALFLKSVLVGEGIEVVIPNEHTIAVQPLWAQFVGGIRLLVREEDYERAADVLATSAPPPPPGDDA